MEILTNAELIFDNGNRHMTAKFRYLGKAEQSVIKYIISKLRKYHGSFFEKYKSIAEELKISTKTVQRAVKHAEQLHIFQVSERFESTLEGKMRKTTNLIQLLAYSPFELINGVIKIVRKVKQAVKLVDMVKKAMSEKSTKSTDKSTKSTERSEKTEKTAQQPKKQYNNKPVRTELLPAWFEDSQKEIEAKQIIDTRSIEEKKNDISIRLASLGIKTKM